MVDGGGAVAATGILAILGLPAVLIGVIDAGTGVFKLVRGTRQLSDAFASPIVHVSPVVYATGMFWELAPSFTGDIVDLLGGTF